MVVAYLVLCTCGHASSTSGAAGPLPLSLVTDVSLPGKAVRFDYQDIDSSEQRLVIAHMDADSVVVVDLRTGNVIKEIPQISTPRGVAVAHEVGLIYVTSSPHQLVLIDSHTLGEVARVETGNGPDGVAWDPTHSVVGVSDQRDGALSLIAGAGRGERKQVKLGDETGNIVYDVLRGQFWITVVHDGAGQLTSVDPLSAKVIASIDLAGCEGAHGLRLHPDNQSAFVACESNDVLARVELAGAHSISTGTTGAGPDVLAIDPALGWLYVAAERGDLTVFDITKPGVVLLGHQAPGSNAHSVAVDASTHRVFFPLQSGPSGAPLLRIMAPNHQMTEALQTEAVEL